MSEASVHTLVGAAKTLAIGRALGEMLRPGDFLALSGPLGAGKTLLVRGVAAGLGVPEDEPVTSPTFVLVREYVGRLKLYHIDAYRLSGDEELWDLGLAEMASQPDSVIAVEWADRFPLAIPPDACRIELNHADRKSRTLRVLWDAPERLAELKSRLPK